MGSESDIAVQSDGVLQPETQARLLESIEAGRLVIICGAGLSMAPPSSLPSAKAVAEKCFDEYKVSIDPDCNPELRGDLERLAEHFSSRKTLKTIFIERLVPWQDFVRPPNKGHTAIADFLIAKVVVGAISGNFDGLIERRAEDFGADLYASLDGDEATLRSNVHSPLLKFHGCYKRDRPNTIWTKSQFTEDPVIAERIRKSKLWMATNLREKDLLFVGFWSDWAYFNGIIGEALTGVEPSSITVIDPTPTEALREKAPELWALANKTGVHFTHITRSGADVLDELRKEFSKSYIRKILSSGKAAFESEPGNVCEPAWLDAPNFDTDELYALRRDAEGIPSTNPARRKIPENCEVLGYFHLLVKKAGAIAVPGGYTLNGKTLRIINGSGKLLSTIQDEFSKEPPAAANAEIVACVGATDFGLPDNVVRSGRNGDIIRPALPGTWVDVQSARRLLQI